MSSPVAPMILALGVNYRTCPLAVREQFSVAKGALAEMNQRLSALDGVEECVVLSTCNRTEIYAWVTGETSVLSRMMACLMGGMSEAQASYFYSHQAGEALYHLAAVAAGLDSMVVGETEIFGQLKDAYEQALAAGTTGYYSNRIFQRAFNIAKKVRHESDITSGPTSVSAAAVQMVYNIHGAPTGQSVLVVGAGDVARTTAQSLRSRGAEAIFVANRSYDKACELAQQVGGEVIRFADWVPHLERVDIIIVSTAAPVYVISPSSLRDVMQRRGGKELFMMDLSVPRNIDPACGDLEGIHLYDIDALEGLAQETKVARHAEMAKCEALLRQWLQENEDNLLKPRAFCAKLAGGTKSPRQDCLAEG